MLFSKWMFLPVLLVCFISCKKDQRDEDHSPVIEKEFNLTGFTKVYSTSGFNLVITKGAGFQVKAKGPSDYVNDIQFRITGGMLDIQYIHDWRRRPEVDLAITVPVLEQFNLAGAAHGTINGFEDENYSIKAIISGSSKGILNGSPVNVAFEIAGGSQLDVKGTATHLYGQLSGAGRLNAYDLTVNEADVEASGESTAYIRAENTLFATASGGSRIYYKGNPAAKHFEESGGGRVIQE